MAKLDKWATRIANERVPLSKWEAESKRWATCAVGEVRRAFPAVVMYKRLIFGGGEARPVDRELVRDGLAFCRAVKADRREMAMDLLRRIHARVLALAAARLSAACRMGKRTVARRRR
jgi:hypothetical protein